MRRSERSRSRSPRRVVDEQRRPWNERRSERMSGGSRDGGTWRASVREAGEEGDNHASRSQRQRPTPAAKELGKRIASVVSFSQLVDILLEPGVEGNLNGIGVATAIHRAGKYRLSGMRERAWNASKTASALEVVASALRRTYQEFDPRGISNICWGIAKGRLWESFRELDVGLMVQLLEQANLKEFDPQSLSNCCWALATVDCNQVDIF